ncbi:hypothetical protein [Bradyrhizobium sp. WSM2254]|uniref:hypothetical protein n=1 Tax=Bradyrhizobium sp. WSM2254 TaxID=1188263 RepID=UPI00042961BF|nr:hypothetical protein [Bradyrhizobium sp. WSM2254]
MANRARGAGIPRRRKRRSSVGSAKRRPTRLGDAVLDLSRLKRPALDQAEFDDARDDLVIEGDYGDSALNPRLMIMRRMWDSKVPMTQTGPGTQIPD